MKKKISDLIIPTPMFKVRIKMTDEITEVNEYTLRNMQLKVSKGEMDRFWFVNTEGGWEKCRKDGILSGEAGSEQWMNTKISPMSITGMLAMELIGFNRIINKKEE